MENTKMLIRLALETINDMYSSLEQLNEILNELTDDNNLDSYTQDALLQCYVALNDPELLDEIAARLGCVEFRIEDEEEF